jgi:hypothetical protein
LKSQFRRGLDGGKYLIPLASHWEPLILESNAAVIRKVKFSLSPDSYGEYKTDVNHPLFLFLTPMVVWSDGTLSEPSLHFMNLQENNTGVTLGVLFTGPSFLNADTFKTNLMKGAFYAKALYKVKAAY